MKNPIIAPLLSAAALLLVPLSCGAAILQWQAAVGTGAPAAATNFSTITSPVVFDVGVLTGDRSFEFIVNLSVGVNPSTALLGNFAAESGRQALKYEQYNKTGFVGATAFGVEDYKTTVPAPSGTDTHVVFQFDGTKTDLYVNGDYKTTIVGASSANFSLALTGSQGLGGALNGAAYVDAIQGSILGFASYDSALSAAEIKTHYNAFAAPVPEAGSAALSGLALLGALTRRRRRIA